MTEINTLQWIKTNLAPLMPVDPIYKEDWLAGIVMRETGILIMRFAPKYAVAEIHLKMRGDYGQRKGEPAPGYHGYGYMQIDINSYPEFIKSGDWQDPVKTFEKAIEALNDKRKYLALAADGENLDKATTAAYNCGQGNVAKALRAMKDVDYYTFNHDYSKEVWRFREIYLTL